MSRLVPSVLLALCVLLSLSAHAKSRARKPSREPGQATLVKTDIKLEPARALWGHGGSIYLATGSSIVRVDPKQGTRAVLLERTAQYLAGIDDARGLTLAGTQQQILWRWSGGEVETAELPGDPVAVVVDARRSVWALAWSPDGGASHEVYEWDASGELHTISADDLGLRGFASLGVGSTGELWLVGSGGGLVTWQANALARVHKALDPPQAMQAGWHSTQTHRTFLLTADPRLLVRDANGHIEHDTAMVHGADRLVGATLAGGLDVVALVTAQASGLTDGRRIHHLDIALDFIDPSTSRGYGRNGDLALAQVEFAPVLRGGAKPSAVHGPKLRRPRKRASVMQGLRLGVGPGFDLGSGLSAKDRTHFALDVRYGFDILPRTRKPRRVAFAFRPDLGYSLATPGRHLFVAGASLGGFNKVFAAMYGVRGVVGRERKQLRYGLRHGLELAALGGLVFVEASHEILLGTASQNVRVIVGTNLMAIMMRAMGS